VSEPAVVTLSLAEFLVWEERQPERYELVGGRAYLMAGGTERHDLMAGQLYERLAPAARAKGCRTFMSNRKLAVPSGDVYYPDVMVVCGPAAEALQEADAALVVEVLSPSTRAQDRREKARQYGTLPSIKKYLVVEPDVRRIEVARWDADRNLSWETLGSGDQLFTPFGVWSLDDIYDAVDATATT
jgi:Uma2 family endonuclease